MSTATEASSKIPTVISEEDATTQACLRMNTFFKEGMTLFKSMNYVPGDQELTKLLNHYVQNCSGVHYELRGRYAGV